MSSWVTKKLLLNTGKNIIRAKKIALSPPLGSKIIRLLYHSLKGLQQSVELSAGSRLVTLRIENSSAGVSKNLGNLQFANEYNQEGTN